ARAAAASSLLLRGNIFFSWSRLNAARVSPSQAHVALNWIKRAKERGCLHFVKSRSPALAQPSAMRLVCPAGTPPSLKAAVDNGADDVYIGFRGNTNARNFAGLNFDDGAVRAAIDYAHARGARVLVALNTYPQPGAFARWQAAVDRAAA